MSDDIMKRFTPKAPNEADLVKLNDLRLAAMAFTERLRRLCPDNYRRARAEEQFEVSVMLAAKSITHHQ